MTEIRQNLENRYTSLDANATIPDFEKYVRLFLDSTEYGLTANIEYPDKGARGTNLLDRNRTEYDARIHSLCAVLPGGASLKVKLFGRIWLFPRSQDWSGWEAGDYNPSDTSVTLTAKQTGRIDLEVNSSVDTMNIQPRVMVYENGADTLTWSKDVIIK